MQRESSTAQQATNFRKRRRHCEPYAFRPFLSSDLTRVCRWLKTPEVSRWWGSAEEQLRFLEADLTEPNMRQWIVEYFGRPFAYVQVYSAQAWPQPHLAHLPISTAVVDLFIGTPTLMGKGHGSAFIRTLAEKLLAEGADAVATDPHYENHQARRAYSRAGFNEEAVVETDDGPVALLVFQRRSSSS